MRRETIETKNQVVNMLLNTVKSNISTQECGYCFTFTASLKWPLRELQFLTHAHSLPLDLPADYKGFSTASTVRDQVVKQCAVNEMEISVSSFTCQASSNKSHTV